LVKPNSFTTYTKNINVSNLNSIWAPLAIWGSQTSQFVNILKYGPDGNLYIGSSLVAVGTEVFWCIFKYNGNEFIRLGNGVQGSVNSIEFDDDDNLYIGGIFINNVPKIGQNSKILNRIAKYNKTLDTWDAISNGNVVGLYNTVNVLKYSTRTKRLYIGGFNRIQDPNISSGFAYLDLDKLSPTYNNFVNVENQTTSGNDYFNGDVYSLEFDKTSSKLYVGGLFSYKNSPNKIYTSVPLGLITDTSTIDYPAFYDNNIQFKLGGTSVRNSIPGAIAFSLLSTDSTHLYMGGNFRIVVNGNNTDIYNLCVFNSLTNTFNPISTYNVVNSTTTLPYTLNPNNTVRTIAQDSNGTIYIGGSFIAMSYAIAYTPISPSSGGQFVNLIGTTYYAELKNGSWSSDFVSTDQVNSIIFKNVPNPTKKDIIVGGIGNTGNIYTGGIQIYTNDYITPFSVKSGTPKKRNCTHKSVIILDPRNYQLLIICLVNFISVGLLSFIKLKDLLYLNGLSLNFM